MFNKATLLFLAFVASSVLAAPISNGIANDVFHQCLDAGRGDAECTEEALAPPSCNKDLITSNLRLSHLQQTPKTIQSVGSPLPDPLAADQGGATLAKVFTALDAADTANTAGDFAAVATNLQTVVDVTSTFLGPLLADGQASGADLDVMKTAEDVVTIANLCASA